MIGKNTTLNKFWIIILLGVMIYIPLTSAFLEVKSDSVSTATDTYAKKYPAIEIKDWLGVPFIGDTVFSGQIDKHSQYCSGDCNSVFTITTYSKGKLIDDIKFLYGTPKSYKFEYLKGTSTINVDDYGVVCGEMNITPCEYIVTGTHEEVVENWQPFDIKAESDAGTYTLKLSADIGNEKIIDWVITSKGMEIGEWATWYGASNVEVMGFTNAQPNGDYSNLEGINIKIGASDITLVRVQVNATTNPTKAYIYESMADGTNKNIANATFSNKNATFSQVLTSGKNYSIVAGSDGGTFTRRYWPSMAPSSRTDFTITAGIEMTFATGATTDYNTNGYMWEDFQYLKGTNPLINLVSPANNTASGIVTTFSCNATLFDSTLKNMSLWIDGVYNDSIAKTGTYNLSSFTKTLVSGTHNWTCKACAVDNTCGSAGENRTVSIVPYTLRNVTYTTPTTSGSYESIILNVTVETGTLNSVILNYNSVNYTLSSSGGLYTKSLNVPTVASSTNVPFYYIFTIDTTQYITSSYNQTVNPIYFGICNATYNKSFINFIFKDEMTSSILNGSMNLLSVNYFLGAGSTQYSYSFTNSTENANYTMCFSPPDKNVSLNNFTVRYSSTGYPQRQVTLTETYLSNITTNKTLYLLSSSDGIYVTFQVVSPSNQNIAGASFSATTSTGNACSGLTDSAGSITCFLDSNVLHTITATKSGYTDYSTSIYPTQTSYTIVMGGSGTTASVDTSRGISYTFLPSSTVILNNTNYDFIFNITSSYNTLSFYGLTILNENGTLIGSTSGTESTGGALTLTRNTGTNTTFYLNANYTVTNGSTVYVTQMYTIFNYYDTGWSLKQLKDDLITYLDTGNGLFGLTRGFSLNMVIFFIILITTGILSYKYGLYSPVAISTCIAALTFMFNFMGLIWMPSGMFEYFPSLFTGIIAIALWVKEVLGY